MRSRAFWRALANEVMVEHLGGEASLVIEYERHALPLAHRPTEKRPFVQVGVDYIRLEGSSCSLHGES